MVFVEIKWPTARLDLASPGAAQAGRGIERREAMSSSRVVEQGLDTVLSLPVLIDVGRMSTSRPRRRTCASVCGTG